MPPPQAKTPSSKVQLQEAARAPKSVIGRKPSVMPGPSNPVLVASVNRFMKDLGTTSSARGHLASNTDAFEAAILGNVPVLIRYSLLIHQCSKVLAFHPAPCRR